MPTTYYRAEGSCGQDKGAAGRQDIWGNTVAVQYYCTVEQVVKVSREVFVPQPKVDSAVLKLSLRKEKPVELIDEETFFACIRGGFGQRRKTLLNSLTGVRGLFREDVREVLADVGIDPVRRAETLNIEEFAAVANAVAVKVSARETK